MTDIKRPLVAITKLLDPHTVLELGSYDGRDSVCISELCSRLFCVEGRHENAMLTATALFEHEAKRAKCAVLEADVREYLAREALSLTYLDLIWASGILYHFDDPIDVIRCLFGVCDQFKCPVIGWTHLADRVETRNQGYEGLWYTEDPVNSPLSSIGNKRSFWMTSTSFERSFTDAGFGTFAFVTEPTAHPNGGLSAFFLASTK